MKKIFALIILSISSINCFLLYGSEEDSLLNLLASENDVKKLETLHKLQQLFLYETKDTYYNNLLEKEAILQKNISYQSLALSNRVAYHYRFFDTDSLFYYAQIAEEFDLQHNLIKDAFHVKEFIIRRYLNQGHYSLALKRAHDMNEEAIKLDNIDARVSSLIALGEAYRALDIPEEAIGAMKEALSLDKVNPNENKAPHKRLQCYQGVVYGYMEEKDYVEALMYCDSLQIETLKVKKAYPTFNLYDFEIAYFLNTASAYIYTDNMEKANQKLTEMEELIKKNYNARNPYFYFRLDKVKSYYYTKAKDWDKTWDSYNSAYKYAMDNHLENDIRDLLLLKAQILHERGLYEESASTYEELFKHIDSINKERFFYEINELRTSYEVDNKETQIAQQNEKIHLWTQFIIFLSIFAVLLLVAIFFILKYSKEITKKNHLLFNQNKELTQTKIQLLAFKELVQQKMGKTNDSNGNHEDLYEKTELFMTANSPYVNSEYGRRNLIADMNTNEVYMAKAIREAMNMTIQEYINFWRMEHAKILLLKDMNQTIEAVAMDSGFTSLRNFYRLFKDTYGMSPTQFRNYIWENTTKKEEKEIKEEEKI